MAVDERPLQEGHDENASFRALCSRAADVRWLHRLQPGRYGLEPERRADAVRVASDFDVAVVADHAVRPTGRQHVAEQLADHPDAGQQPQPIVSGVRRPEPAASRRRGAQVEERVLARRPFTAPSGLW
jgi:hypothetical protein